MYIYIYIYIHTCYAHICRPPPPGHLQPHDSRNINDSSAAHIVISFASSETLKSRLLK